MCPRALRNPERLPGLHRPPLRGALGSGKRRGADGRKRLPSTREGNCICLGSTQGLEYLV